jgi:hypothetical protein
MAFGTVSLNYSHAFNSWFDISTGIYRYQVSPSLKDTLFNNFTYGDFTLGLDWRLLYSKFSAGALFSDENQLYFQVRNSRYFQTSEIMKKSMFISFDPYINLLFGTLTTAETKTNQVITKKVIPPFAPGIIKKQNNPEVVYSQSFNIMELDIGLPIAFNFNFMTLEAETNYIIRLNTSSEAFSAKGFLFMLSGYIRIL